MNSKPSTNPRILLIQVAPKHLDKTAVQLSLDETKQLIATYGGKIIESQVQYRHPDRNTYLGKGKLEWLRKTVKDQDIDIVIINDIIRSAQIYRLEKKLWDIYHLIKVWDRVDLILNIFDQHATTTESKLQIQLARLKHIGPRARGLGQDFFSRQGGGVGTRGLGETNIEIEQRHLRHQMHKIQKQLQKIENQKQSRLNRRSDQGIGPVALVGYTSAGKTTLFNALTGKQKQTNLGLFTTLDTVVGKLKIPNQSQPILISDTIGFIADLPPDLIQAFNSTLMESLQAQLILHVIDATDHRLNDKVRVVNQILQSLHADQPTILVFNKLDQIDHKTRNFISLQYADYNHIFISSKTGQRLEQLKQRISQHFFT